MKIPSIYTILGYVLTTAFLFILWLIVKPKDNIDPILFNASNIDSLQIEKGNKIITIKNPRDLIPISNQLKKLRSTKVDRLKVSRGLVFLNFFTKKEMISFTIVYGGYDGIVFDFNSSFYKNDSLNALITNCLGSN